MKTVPLAHSLTITVEEEKPAPAYFQRLIGKRFVSFISTIEARKNHIYAFEVWRRLIDQGIDMPDLVFVGRRGWKVDPLFELLEASSCLNGKVHVVHDLSDAELSWVYENSLFTIFTSLVEGWGLPVGESLMHGTPCIAADSSSIPEVGDEFVDYVDPTDVSTGINTVLRMLSDEYRSERKTKIAENFKPRDWREVCNTFVDACRELSELAPPVPWRDLKLREGEAVHFDELAWRPMNFREYASNPFRLLVHESFDVPTEAGAWLRGSSARITFATDLDEGSDIECLFLLSCTNERTDYDVSIGIEGSERLYNIRPLPAKMLRHGQFVRARGLVAHGGKCSVVIQVVSEEWVPDRAVGVRGFGFAAKDNLSARQDVVDTLVFRSA